MNRYIICFDVKSPTKRKGAIKYLKRGKSFRINPSSFFFESPETPIQIHKDWNEIKPLSLEDVFYVFSVCEPWTGHGDLGLSAYLRKIRGKENQSGGIGD